MMMKPATRGKSGFSYARLSDRHGRRGPIIPDPNMRVQAVIDGQGVALFDDLVKGEVSSGQLAIPSPVTLSGFGYYLVVAEHAGYRKEVLALLDWLKAEAAKEEF
jgi:DNA-binding transcriptional LysR family regulator